MAGGGFIDRGATAIQLREAGLGNSTNKVPLLKISNLVGSDKSWSSSVCGMSPEELNSARGGQRSVLCCTCPAYRPGL